MATGRMLQLDDDDAFQRRMWVIERIGWTAFALIIVAALTGFCGPGPLSSATKASGEVQVSFDRFVRLQSPAVIELVLPVQGETVRLQVSRAFLDEMSIEQVTPDPESVDADSEFHTYVFTPAEGATSIRATFAGRPEKVGRIKARFEIEGGDAVSFTQFVYP